MIKVHRGNFLYTLNSIRQSLFSFLESEMAKRGIRDIYASHGDILHVLDKKGRVNLSDISKLSLKDKSTITAVINHLEKSGYVTKTRDSQDRRVVNIEVTEKGKKVRPALTRISERMNTRLFEGLSAQEKTTLFNLLTRVGSNVDQLQE
jgi:DNA-binding MarR family transcriptional regulator